MAMEICNTASYARNSVFMGGVCGITSDQPLTEKFNAFWGNTTDGCGTTVSPAVSDDPLFSNFPDDLSLLPGSPLIDAGDPNATYDDVDGSRNDIGMYGGPWGQ
jgi:hypothetical protein